MAGFTQVEITTILATLMSVLKQGGNRVRFPDGSEVQYPNRKELLEEYSYWLSQQSATDPSAPLSSFYVRTTKGVD